MPSLSHVLVTGLASCALAAAVGPGVAGAQAPATGPAPGAPGTVEQALPADKSGFGTSTARASKVWFTVQKEGGLGELFAPTIDAPSARALEFVVADRRGHAVRASDADRVKTTLTDARSLTYRQTFTKRRSWRLTATYVTDPARATVLIDLRFAVVNGRRHDVYAIYDPSLSNTRNDDSGRTEGNALVATDDTTKSASALVAAPALAAKSSGFRGISDGWTDLLADGRLDWHYTSADSGNLVQTAATALTAGPATSVRRSRWPSAETPPRRWPPRAPRCDAGSPMPPVGTRRAGTSTSEA